MSYLIVDEMHHEHPELIKDQYWDEVFPSQLPYTLASVQNKESEPQPSTANIEVTKRAAEVIPVVPSSAKMDDMVCKTSSTAIYKFPDKGDDSDEQKDYDEVRPTCPKILISEVVKVHKRLVFVIHRVDWQLSFSLSLSFSHSNLESFAFTYVLNYVFAFGTLLKFSIKAYSKLTL